MIGSNRSSPPVETMISPRQAADSLQLPRYWFATPQLRARRRIPHYRLLGRVRFRLSELMAWASQRSISGSQIHA